MDNITVPDQTFPNEIFAVIFEFLGPRTMERVAVVSKKWLEVSRSNDTVFTVATKSVTLRRTEGNLVYYTKNRLRMFAGIVGGFECRGKYYYPPNGVDYHVTVTTADDSPLDPETGDTHDVITVDSDYTVEILAIFRLVPRIRRAILAEIAKL